jgi:hypothetical protein
MKDGWLSSVMPGLTRQSIFFAKRFAERMDPWVKPAGDDGE